MSAIPAPQRVELSPAVRAILEADTPKSQLLRHFLHFSEAILAPDPAGIDRVVTPDARFHELEAIGYPRGPEGLKVFRRQVNAAIPDEHIFVTAVRFEGNDIIEADLDISGTHTGEDFMGIPATGRKIRFDVQARGRFVDDKMAERWDRANFEDIKRQLTEPLSRRQSYTYRARRRISLTCAERWLAAGILDPTQNSRQWTGFSTPTGIVTSNPTMRRSFGLLVISGFPDTYPARSHF
jgi:predicted ester cyclase